MESCPSNRILIVDDEEHVLKALKRALMDEDYEIVSTTSPVHALELVRRRPFKVIICDERMPNMFGSELLARISLRQPEIVKMLLTGYASVEAAIRAVNQGEIFRFLVKPWNDFELKMSLRAGIDKYDLEMKNRKLQALVRAQAYRLAAQNRSAPGQFELDGAAVIDLMSDDEIAGLLIECGIEVCGSSSKSENPEEKVGMPL